MDGTLLLNFWWAHLNLYWHLWVGCRHILDIEFVIVRLAAVRISFCGFRYFSFLRWQVVVLGNFLTSLDNVWILSPDLFLYQMNHLGLSSLNWFFLRSEIANAGSSLGVNHWFIATVFSKGWIYWRRWLGSLKFTQTVIFVIFVTMDILALFIILGLHDGQFTIWATAQLVIVVICEKFTMTLIVENSE